MKTELTPIKLGLTPTGQENTHDPRKEYRFNEKGRYNLAHFFNINPISLKCLDTPTIWLGRATIEDLLIFQALRVELQTAVLVEQDDSTPRTLFATSDEADIESAVRAKQEVYINPDRFLKPH